MDTLMRICGFDWSALPCGGEIVWSERRGRWERPEAVPLKYDEAAGAEPSDRGDAFPAALMRCNRHGVSREAMW
jgi:hypothetical protein